MALCSENPAPKGEHEFVDVPNGDGPQRCVHCDSTYAQTLAGFGSNSSQFSMPPSKSHRRKSAVAKRFGQAFGDGD